MTITARTTRPLTWQELDDNFQTIKDAITTMNGATPTIVKRVGGTTLTTTQLNANFTNLRDAIGATTPPTMTLYSTGNRVTWAQMDANFTALSNAIDPVTYTVAFYVDKGYVA